MHGQRQHRHVRALLLDAPRGLDAVHVRHGDVHQHHVGRQFAGQAHAFRAVLRLADDLQLGIGAQQHAQPRAHDRVIIDQQDPYRAHACSFDGR